jgi:hypothetical protein
MGERPLNCPIETSRKNVGIPTRKRRIKKGTRKAAPPFLNTRNGNRQTFPRPFLSSYCKIIFNAYHLMNLKTIFWNLN